MVTFAAMNKTGNTRISALFFLLFIASLSVKTAHTAPVAHKPVNREFSERLQQFPNRDLEISYSPVTIVWQVVVQKNLLQQDFVLSATTHQHYLSSISSYNKRFSSLIRDYLLHIYPTHNFWWSCSFMFYYRGMCKARYLILLFIKQRLWIRH